MTPLVLAVTALALAATALLYAVTAGVIRSETEAALRQTVDIEIAALADVHATGGREELVARIRDRLMLKSLSGDFNHYILADQSGRPIAGNIPHWPLLSAENSEAGFISLDGGVPAFARATLLSPELRLVAAREYGGRTRLLARVRDGFLLAGLGILAAAILVGWAASARLRRRVERANEALRAIAGGDLTSRLPEGRTQDELGEMAVRVNALVERLGQVISAQREVTDQVAHEVRTPLVHLDAQLLRMIERSSDPSITASLGAVRQEARDVAALLDSLLDIAASEARRGDRTGLEPVSLSAIGASLLDLYAESAAEAGLVLRGDVAPGVTISGDRMQLSRAISNLFDNAFKYAGEGATIELRIEPGPRIVVRDDGRGVPAHLRESIFDRFTRGPAGGSGHGLGLALVKAIAERHGLRVRCIDAAPGAQFVMEAEGPK